MFKWLRFLAIFVSLSPQLYAAPAIPTGLTSTTGYVDGTITMQWAYDVTPQQWYIYLNGSLFLSPTRSQVQLVGQTTTSYTLTGVSALSLPAVINMRALASGQVSGYSSNITVTGASSGIPVSVSGIASVSGNVSLTAGTATIGNVGVTSTVRVAQASAWTVSGSVSVTNFPTEYLGVTVVAQNQAITVAGTVAATQGSAYLVSGSVGVTSGVAGISTTASLAAGTNYVGAVGVSTTVTVAQGSAWLVSGSVSAVPSGAYQGVSVFSGVAGLSTTASLATGTNYVGAVGVSLPSGTSISVSLPAYTSTNPLPVGVTINAVTTNLRTDSGSTSGLNIANAFDYDVNTNTAYSRRGAPTTSTYMATSGTTTIFAGYGLVYSITVFPSTVSNSKLTMFDGATTRTTISTLSAGFYHWPRGVQFGLSCTAQVTGVAFDGAVTIETIR